MVSGIRTIEDCPTGHDSFTPGDPRPTVHRLVLGSISGTPLAFGRPCDHRGDLLGPGHTNPRIALGNHSLLYGSGRRDEVLHAGLLDITEFVSYRIGGSR